MATTNSTASIEDLSLYLTTFNCGRKPVDLDFFSSYFFSALSPPRLPPDLIVLCLQEIAPLGYSFLGGSFLTSYFSELAEAVKQAVRGLDNEAGNPPTEYLNIATRNVGMIAIMVFAKPEVVDRVKWMESAEVGIGTWEMGNKGAVGVRLGMVERREGDETVPLTFVAAHLQPMEGACEERNADWKAINENMVFSRDVSHPAALGGKGAGRGGVAEAEPLLSQGGDVAGSLDTMSTLFHPPSHLFFAGDLNYRTSDKPPQAQEWQRWPADDAPMKKFQLLLRQDQLTRELEEGRTLHGLAEAPITFAPTYKYNGPAQKRARKIAESQTSISKGQQPNGSAEVEHIAKSPTQSSNDETDAPTSASTTATETPPTNNASHSSYHWAKHRVPSWCDRILYAASHPPRIHAYTSLPIQPTSDHRPVVLHCTIPLLPPSAASGSSKTGAITGLASPHTAKFEVRDDFEARRAAARRLEVVVGIASYLTMTTEGEVLVLGTAVGLVGGWILLRTLLEFGV